MSLRIKTTSNKVILFSVSLRIKTTSNNVILFWVSLRIKTTSNKVILFSVHTVQCPTDDSIGQGIELNCSIYNRTETCAHICFDFNTFFQIHEVWNYSHDSWRILVCWFFFSDPRENVNSVTAFVDGSAIYGSSEERMRELRENNGTGISLPQDVSRLCFFVSVLDFFLSFFLCLLAVCLTPVPCL